MALDEQLNDYFVRGMEQAIIRETGAGNIIPPFNDEIYAVKKEEPKEESMVEGVITDEAATPSDGATETRENIVEDHASIASRDPHQPTSDEDTAQSGTSPLVMLQPNSVVQVLIILETHYLRLGG